MSNLNYLIKKTLIRWQNFLEKVIEYFKKK